MYTLYIKEGIMENDKLNKQIKNNIIKNAQINIIKKIYKELNNNYFADYLKQDNRESSKEILEYLILLNFSLVF